MAVQTTPFTLPVLLAGAGYAAFGVYLLRRPQSRRNRGSGVAAWLLLGVGVWLLAYAGQLSVTAPDAKLAFQRLKYVGPTTVPLLWFAYVLDYTGHREAVPRVAWVVLAVPPAVFAAAAATYPATTLVWTDVALIQFDDWVAFTTDHGPLFFAYQGYVYALFLATLWLLVGNLRRSTGVYRRQTLGLIVGGLLPGVLGLVHIADLEPLPGVDLPAVALAGTAAAVAWNVARNDLFTLEPVAWETAIAQLEDPVFVLDEDDRVLAANDAAVEFASDPVGKPASRTLGQVLARPVWTELGDHEVDGARGGEQRVYEVSVSPVERDGTRLGRVVVVRDVTERTDREERLDEFASVVSHDLRNPLNVATGNLELARETGDDAHVAEAQEALERMERIIEDLLTLARQGETDFDREPRSLEATARTAWGAVDAPDATLDVASDTTLHADETAFLRLLENLFRNSVEHGDEGEGPSVTVTVGATADGFFVADDGPGIPAAEHQRVFEHGYTTREDGTGFGLAIVADIADAHGWDVSLTESEAGGARFEFDVA